VAGRAGNRKGKTRLKRSARRASPAPSTPRATPEPINLDRAFHRRSPRANGSGRDSSWSANSIRSRFLTVAIPVRCPARPRAVHDPRTEPHVRQTQTTFLIRDLLPDGLLVAGSWLGRTGFDSTDWTPAPLGVPQLSFYLWAGAVLTPVALFTLHSLHIYRSARTTRLRQEILALCQGIVIITALAGLAPIFPEASSVAPYCSCSRSSPRFPSAARTRESVSPSDRRGGAEGTFATSWSSEPGSWQRTSNEDGRSAGFRVRGGGCRVRESADVGKPFGTSRIIGTVSELHELVERTGAELVYSPSIAPSGRRRTRRWSGSAIRPPRCGWFRTWPARSR